jgi:hypothetical protein
MTIEGRMSETEDQTKFSPLDVAWLVMLTSILFIGGRLLWGGFWWLREGEWRDVTMCTLACVI